MLVPGKSPGSSDRTERYTRHKRLPGHRQQSGAWMREPPREPFPFLLGRLTTDYAMNDDAIRSISNGVPASTLKTTSAPSGESTCSPLARACRLSRS